MDITAKVAVVTGAGSGIGKSSAQILAKAGMRVAVCGRRMALLQDTVAEILADGGSAVAVQVDVTDEASVQAMVRQVLEQWGAIDLLLNNAGSFRHVGPAWEATPEIWWEDVKVNLFGSFLCIKYILPMMIQRNSGFIINMDGGGGARPNLGGSSYACSKAALLRLNEQLAVELRHIQPDVLVFGMNPGFVPTDMTKGLARHPNGDQWQSFVGTLLENGQGHKPGDCGEAILKLLSIASPQLSGRVFSVETDFARIDNTKQAIAEEDLFVLRVVEPK